MVKVKDVFGVLPTSCMEFKNVPAKWKAYDAYLKINLKRRSDTCKHLPGLKYSKFSYGLSEFTLLYWSEVGDVVLDPFMGWGIRGVVATKLGRDYIGYDISNEMFNVAETFIKKASSHNSLLNDKTGKFTLYNYDGITLKHIADNSIDMILTCPPYFDREKYPGENENQLSKIKGYDNFLNKIGEALERQYNVLKSNKYCVWVVGDWRNNGLYLFHNDVITLAQKAGFKIWDVIISKLRSPFVHKQIGKCARMRYTAKTHEYIIVMKKV